MVIGYEGFFFLDHVSEGIQLDPDRAILLLFALHSLSYFFEIINLHIQSNNIFILNKIKYTQMEAISNFFFGKEQDLENPDD